MNHRFKTPFWAMLIPLAIIVAMPMFASTPVVSSASPAPTINESDRYNVENDVSIRSQVAGGVQSMLVSATASEQTVISSESNSMMSPAQTATGANESTMLANGVATDVTAEQVVDNFSHKRSGVGIIDTERTDGAGNFRAKTTGPANNFADTGTIVAFNRGVGDLGVSAKSATEVKITTTGAPMAMKQF